MRTCGPRVTDPARPRARESFPREALPSRPPPPGSSRDRPSCRSRARVRATRAGAPPESWARSRAGRRCCRAGARGARAGCRRFCREGAALPRIAAKLRLRDSIVEADLLLLLEEAAEHAGLPALGPRGAVLAGRIRTALAILAGETGELNAQASNDPETGTANRHEGAYGVVEGKRVQLLMITEKRYCGNSRGLAVGVS